MRESDGVARASSKAAAAEPSRARASLISLCYAAVNEQFTRARAHARRPAFQFEIER